MAKVIRNILRGFGSIGGVYPIQRNIPKLSCDKRTIAESMQEDWRRVGDDILAAMRRFENEIQKKELR